MLSARKYDFIVQKLRRFFANHKQFIEVPAQSRHAILTAHNPKTLATYTMSGMKWALPQSGQMILEHELLNNASFPGVYCITSSYRNEENSVLGRYQKLFPLFEFESCGTSKQLKELERELLQYLGFSESRIFSYESLCRRYNVEILHDSEESKIWEELGDVISVQDFPERTNPFFTIKRGDDGLSQKVDLILYGMEAIGFAERSCDVDQIRHDFFTLSGGNYAQLLFERFGKDRVIAELESFLAKKMVPRFGGSIGISRLIRAMELANLLDTNVLAWQQSDVRHDQMQSSMLG